jgi:hypothetical protein
LALKVCNKFNFHGLTPTRNDSDTIVSLSGRDNRSSRLHKRRPTRASGGGPSCRNKFNALVMYNASQHARLRNGGEAEM